MQLFLQCLPAAPVSRTSLPTHLFPIKYFLFSPEQRAAPSVTSLRAAPVPRNAAACPVSARAAASPCWPPSTTEPLAQPPRACLTTAVFR